MNTIKTLALGLLIAVTLAFAATAGANTDKMVEQMLVPSVRISNGTGFGSGTAIKTDPYIGTYIVTNYHVMVNDKYGMKVQFYGEEKTYPAFLHSVDVQNDIAVIITPHIHHAVAKIGKPPSVFNEAYCVGAPYGAPLAPSKGIITGTGVKVFGTRFMTRTDCKIAPGNSGGGMYVEQDGVWVYVGMPSMVKSVSLGFQSIPITFLGLSVRIEDITKHLFMHGVYRATPPAFVGKHSPQ